jgi:hypothetical protein
MCAYSAISDYYTDPKRWGYTSPIQSMDGETVRLLKEVADKLDKIDKRLNDIECNDPRKKIFKRAIDKRIRETRPRA